MQGDTIDTIMVVRASFAICVSSAVHFNLLFPFEAVS